MNFFHSILTLKSHLITLILFFHKSTYIFLLEIKHEHSTSQPQISIMIRKNYVKQYKTVPRDDERLVSFSFRIKTNKTTQWRGRYRRFGGSHLALSSSVGWCWGNEVRRSVRDALAKRQRWAKFWPLRNAGNAAKRRPRKHVRAAWWPPCLHESMSVCRWETTRPST